MHNSKTVAVAASLGARVITALLSFAFLPIFLKLLGPDAYGIIGFYTTLLVAVNLLDGGLSAALNRQLAQSDDASSRGEILSAAVALFLCLSLTVIIATLFAAPWIGHHWLRASTLSDSEVVWSLRVMAIAFGEQLLISCYQGALYGLHKQLWLNTISLITVVLRVLASFAVLLFISPTPTALLATFSVFAALQILAMRLAISREIPLDPFFRRYRWSSSKFLLRATTGIGLMGVLSVALGQADKLIVSRSLSLADFSYYIVAATAAQIPILFMISVVLSLFPHFAALAARDRKQMVELYHLSSQFIASVTIPVGVVFALFPSEILFAWTGSALVAERVAPVLAILTVANSLYVYWEINHYYEVSNSRARFFIIAYFVAFVIEVPVLIFATRVYGMIGAASVWLSVAAIYLFCVTPLIMRSSLRGQLGQFYWQSVAIPILVSLFVGALARFLVPAHLGRVQSGAVILSMLVIAVPACALAMPVLRARIPGLAKQVFGSGR